MPNRRMRFVILALRLQTLCIVLTGACLLGCESMHQRRELIALAVQPSNADAIAPGGTAPFTGLRSESYPRKSMSPCSGVRRTRALLRLIPAPGLLRAQSLAAR
jgi:hypothetical protein